MQTCSKCSQPATLKEGRTLYCAPHYKIDVMGVSTTTINGKPILSALKAA